MTPWSISTRRSRADGQLARVVPEKGSIEVLVEGGMGATGSGELACDRSPAIPGQCCVRRVTERTLDMRRQAEGESRRPPLGSRSCVSSHSEWEALCGTATARAPTLRHGLEGLSLGSTTTNMTLP